MQRHQQHHRHPRLHSQRLPTPKQAQGRQLLPTSSRVRRGSAVMHLRVARRQQPQHQRILSLLRRRRWPRSKPTATATALWGGDLHP